MTRYLILDSSGRCWSLDGWAADRTRAWTTTDLRVLNHQLRELRRCGQHSAQPWRLLEDGRVVMA
jgi:hypothetical protein